MRTLKTLSRAAAVILLTAATATAANITEEVNLETTNSELFNEMMDTLDGEMSKRASRTVEAEDTISFEELFDEGRESRQPKSSHKRGGKKGAEGKSFRDGGKQMGRGLDLTEEQKVQIKELKMGTMKESLELKNRLGELAAIKRSLSTGDNIDIKAIEKNIDETFEIRAELAKTAANLKLDIRELLNDEQKIKFDMNHGKKHGGKQKMGNRRGGDERRDSSKERGDHKRGERDNNEDKS